MSTQTSTAITSCEYDAQHGGGICWYCTGESCWPCYVGARTAPCRHDVSERHPEQNGRSRA